MLWWISQWALQCLQRHHMHPHALNMCTPHSYTRVQNKHCNENYNKLYLLQTSCQSSGEYRGTCNIHHYISQSIQVTCTAIYYLYISTCDKIPDHAATSKYIHMHLQSSIHAYASKPAWHWTCALHTCTHVYKTNTAMKIIINCTSSKQAVNLQGSIEAHAIYITIYHSLYRSHARLYITYIYPLVTKSQTMQPPVSIYTCTCSPAFMQAGQLDIVNRGLLSRNSPSSTRN